MSGTNGINKYARTNRDGQIENVQILGALAQYGSATATGTNATLTVPQLTSGQLDVGPSSGSILFPNGYVWETGIEGTYPTSLGSYVENVFLNSSNVPKVVTFPGTVANSGPFPGHSSTMTTADGTNTVTIPPNSALTLRIVNQGPENYKVYPEAGTSGSVLGIASITNVGTGSSLVVNGLPPAATVRAIVGGIGLTDTIVGTDVVLNFSGANLGAGVPLYVAGVLATDPANFKTLVAGAGISVTDNGAAGVTLASTTTQQIAYNNSSTLVNFPTIQLNDAYNFTVGTGPTRALNTRRVQYLDTDNTSSLFAITAPQANAFIQKRAPPFVGPFPDYDNVPGVTRNLDFLQDTTSVGGLGLSSIRSINHNNNLNLFVYGSVTEGRPAVTDAAAPVPFINPILDGSAATTWYPNAQTHPDDPNTGWNGRNYSYTFDGVFDNTTLAAPLVTNGVTGIWTHFSENGGISPYNVQPISYPVNTHFGCNRTEYDLGCFRLWNALGANPAFCDMDFGKNLRISQFSTSPSEFSVTSFRIILMANEYSNAAAPAGYRQEYECICVQSTPVFAPTITLINSVQNPASVVAHPPPSITIPPFDIRPGARLRITNGADGVNANRKFFYQVSVTKRILCHFNPT